MNALRVTVLATLAAGCGSSTPLSEETAEAARVYPDVFKLYAGDQGIYRGCGPSGGVCHNSNEFPNLASLGSIVDNIGRDCNQKRMDPSTVHDLCERSGDQVLSGNAASEIAWIERVDMAARTWRAHLREPIALSGDLEIQRDDKTLYFLGDVGVTASADPADASAIMLTVTPPPTSTPDDPAEDFNDVVARSGVPGDPAVIRVGDPNRNGTFGGELGGKIIKPGDPARSYLMSRLLDPSAGPLMPRANCCSWSKPAVRALYCWIEGLAADSSNAMSPIDYERCSTGPSVDLLYPELGPDCEGMALCPVEAAPADDDPTFHNVYARVLVSSCAGSTCHGSGDVAGVDFTSEQRAFDTLAARVVAGNPEASLFYLRLDPTLCVGPDCVTMPLGRAPIAEAKRALVRAWIDVGARR